MAKKEEDDNLKRTRQGGEQRSSSSDGEIDQDGDEDGFDDDLDADPNLDGGVDGSVSAPLPQVVEQATLDKAVVAACRKGHGEIVELLLFAGAGPNGNLQSGSAIEAALAADCEKAVRVLLQVC